MAKVRIKLNSTDIEMLNNICDSIKEIARKSGINIIGPVPLPNKEIKGNNKKISLRRWNSNIRQIRDENT